MEKIYLVVSNSDLTEGRGRPINLAYCASQATAKRLSKKKGVMGSDAEVRAYDVLFLDGKPVIPLSLLTIEFATKEDEAEQKRIESVDSVIRKAKEAGITEDELIILRSSK